MATLIGYVGYLILKFYNPGKIQKKLDKWRYMPRISSKGNEMKLLSEEEEDVYLDAGMQAEENIFSVDYDVWVDEENEPEKNSILEAFENNPEIITKAGEAAANILGKFLNRKKTP